MPRRRWEGGEGSPSPPPPQVAGGGALLGPRHPDVLQGLLEVRTVCSRVLPLHLPPHRHRPPLPTLSRFSSQFSYRIHEDDDEITLTLSLPGYSAETIDLSLNSKTELGATERVLVVSPADSTQGKGEQVGLQEANEYVRGEDSVF